MKRLLIRDNNVFNTVLKETKTDTESYTYVSTQKITIFPIMTLHFWWKGERVMTSIWCSMQTQQAQELRRSMLISIILYYG